MPNDNQTWGNSPPAHNSCTTEVTKMVAALWLLFKVAKWLISKRRST